MEMTPRSTNPLDPWIEPLSSDKEKEQSWQPHDDKDQDQSEKVNDQLTSFAFWRQTIVLEDIVEQVKCVDQG